MKFTKDKSRFNLKTIELKDIRDAFAKVKTSNSFGIDDIPSYFLKLALPYIGNFLAFLFNTSIKTSRPLIAGSSEATGRAGRAQRDLVISKQPFFKKLKKSF